jgi:hypothetical protein
MTDERIAALASLADKFGLSETIELCRLARLGKHAAALAAEIGELKAERDRLRDEVAALRFALADAIRRPLGVIPDSAVGLLTAAELDAAELRRLTPRNK